MDVHDDCLKYFSFYAPKYKTLVSHEINKINSDTLLFILYYSFEKKNTEKNNKAICVKLLLFIRTN